MILAMMFKESFSALNMEGFGIAALVIFVGVFASIAIWAGVQRREEVRRWSDLPLADDDRPRGAKAVGIPADEEEEHG